MSYCVKRQDSLEINIYSYLGSIKDKERLKINIDWRDEYQGCVMRQDGLKINELLLLSKL